MRRMYSENQIQALADARVKSLVEGGTLDNAKPLYFHPIVLVQSSPAVGLSFIIIDNNPEPYDTFAKFKEKCFGIATAIEGTARFPCSGVVSNRHACSMDATSTKLLVYGFVDSSYGSTDITDFTISSVFDGVNKIN